ncbi:hypothetical protein NPIL_62441 [Nephila pilipes]|uniref:Uncharacterized protein n=1 Tax=Nephila pilipes TaxID=299642 RepID=A0A8X6MW57_NEPPI|nr:hypothetical protein NPIL_62441 [Nephila pilipes]
MDPINESKQNQKQLSQKRFRTRRNHKRQSQLVFQNICPGQFRDEPTSNLYSQDLLTSVNTKQNPQTCLEMDTNGFAPSTQTILVLEQFTFLLKKRE